MKRSPSKKAKDGAWKAFSIYIRTRFMDEYEQVKCVTCGKKMHWKQAQAGHFIGGRHNSLLFDERNCHAQCVGCNMFGRGKFAEYLTYMKSMYGNEIIDELLALDKEIVKYKQSDYEELEKFFKGKVNL